MKATESLIVTLRSKPLKPTFLISINLSQGTPLFNQIPSSMASFDEVSALDFIRLHLLDDFDAPVSTSQASVSGSDLSVQEENVHLHINSSHERSRKFT